MSVELRHLRVLVAVVDEGTFTAAAAALRTGQPAVSRTLAQLERLIGARLLDRTTREVRLTEAGRRSYRAAVTALRAVDAVSDAASDRTRPLRLGFSWAALGRLTPQVLTAWRERFPEQALEVRRIDTRDAGLRRGAVDVAVIRGDFADPGIRTEVMFTEPRVAAVPAAHPLAAREEVRLSDVAAEVVILTPSVGTTSAALWPADARPSRTRTVGNLDEWLTAIAAGDGVGVTTAATAFSYPVPGVAYRSVADAPDVAVRVAWPEVAPHPAAADLVELIRQTVADGTMPS